MPKTKDAKPAGTGPERQEWDRKTGTKKTSIAKKKFNAKKLREFKGRAKGRNDRIKIKKDKLDNMFVNKMAQAEDKIKEIAEKRALRKAAKKRDAEEGKKIDPLDKEAMADDEMSEGTSVYGDSEFDEVMEDDEMETITMINLPPDV